MSKRWLILAFVLVAVAQLAVPVVLILQRAAILRTGRAYKFRTRPVDPADPFRGRYVQLAFDQNHAPWRSHAELQHGQELFACVADGSDGFAVIQEVKAVRPDQRDYVKVQVSWWQKNEVYFTLPFDRYYLQETKAPKAEQTYQEHNRRSSISSDTYVVVRIKAGDAVLADLYVGGQPIQAYFTNRKP